MKTLNEKEIQEKLYGKYRVPKKAVEATGSEAEILDRSLASPSEFIAKPSNISTDSAQKPLSQTQKPNSISYTNFTKTNTVFTSHSPIKTEQERQPIWKQIEVNSLLKMSGLIAIGLIGTLFAGQIFVKHQPRKQMNGYQESKVVMHRAILEEPRREISALQAKKSSESPAPILESAAKTAHQAQISSKRDIKIEPIISRSVRSEDSLAAAAAVDSARAGMKPKEEPEIQKIIPGEKLYSVQICTYRSESDAQKLVGRLKESNLSAFYQEVPGRQDGGNSKFFLVLLGKEPSYSDAQARLSEFKQLPISKEFSDSYIRRL